MSSAAAPKSKKRRTLREAIFDHESGLEMPKAVTVEVEHSSIVPTPAPKDDPAPKATSGVAQVRVVNGKIVLDQESVAFDRVDHNRKLDLVREDGTRTGGYPSRSGAAGWRKWTSELDSKFYSCLQKYGTDFDTIALVFPQFSRKDVLLKFRREEKKNKSKVDHALSNPLPADEADFAHLDVADDVIESPKK